ncbi:hypothetical protein pb186bvf_017792 [Paramecium bursaria]
MNKLLALLLLIFIVSANLRGTTDQEESTEIDEYESLQYEAEQQLNNLQQQQKKYEQNISDGDEHDIKQDQAEQLSKQIEIEILKIKNIIQYIALEVQEMKQYISLVEKVKKDDQKKLYRQKILLQKVDEGWDQIENELNKKKAELKISQIKLKQAQQDNNLAKKEFVDSGLASQEILSELENYNQDQKVRKRINRSDSVKQYQLRVSSGTKAL